MLTKPFLEIIKYEIKFIMFDYLQEVFVLQCDTTKLAFFFFLLCQVISCLHTAFLIVSILSDLTHVIVLLVARYLVSILQPGIKRLNIKYINRTSGKSPPKVLAGNKRNGQQKLSILIDFILLFLVKQSCIHHISRCR